MMSLLDGIVENMTTGAKVVSANHDASTINWVSGLSDPGEMLGCGKYQQLRRLQGESDADYQTRLVALLPTIPAQDREKIETAMKAAAHRRAGLDMSNGRVNVMSAGQLPWYGLGVQIDRAANSKEAVIHSGLANWNLGKRTLYYTDDTGTQREAPDVYGIVRGDTGEMLGSVGKRYKIIPNEEAFAFLDGVLEEFGAKYETAGSLYGGKKVWMLAHLPKQGFTVNGGDRQEPYVIFENVHDGSGSAACYPTAVRVVCANTLRMANGDKGKGLSIRHTGNVKDKIASAQAALNIAVTEFEDYAVAAESLYRKPLAIEHYANDVLDAVLDVTAAQAKMGSNSLAAMLDISVANQELEAKKIEKKIERRGEILADILGRYETESERTKGIRGTAWHAMNAITESADHAKIGKQASDLNTRASRRFESAISGAADEMKQAAFAIAMKA